MTTNIIMYLKCLQKISTILIDFYLPQQVHDFFAHHISSKVVNAEIGKVKFYYFEIALKETNHDMFCKRQERLISPVKFHPIRQRSSQTGWFGFD